ncbi:mitogen activated protein kinase kinase kinase [Echinococcus multilocularis]|uniref:Mitogen activated protein kinase kinase kinase n=1 Tax=Echinococcus multilocularis TaxID=6211 RepID=A0A0S4MI97_ECHMU|nr:mitogen activated protein kinase kinase kinase [Echinococcus multilocularis]
MQAQRFCHHQYQEAGILPAVEHTIALTLTPVNNFVVPTALTEIIEWRLLSLFSRNLGCGDEICTRWSRKVDIHSVVATAWEKLTRKLDEEKSRGQRPSASHLIRPFNSFMRNVCAKSTSQLYIAFENAELSSISPTARDFSVSEHGCFAIGVSYDLASSTALQLSRCYEKRRVASEDCDELVLLLAEGGRIVIVESRPCQDVCIHMLTDDSGELKARGDVVARVKQMSRHRVQLSPSNHPLSRPEDVPVPQ